MNHDLTTPAGIKALMESSTSESDWNKNCDEIKKANGGYPNFWYETIILGGVLGKCQIKWMTAKN